MISVRMRTFACLVFACFTALSAAGPAAAESLPPVHVTYDDSFTFEITSAAKTYAEHGSWMAEGSSGGKDGSLPLEVTHVEGERTNLNNFLCEGESESVKWEIDAASNPIEGGWSLEESSGYPLSKWKYLVAGTPYSLPLIVKMYCPPAYNPLEQDVQMPVAQIASPEPVPPKAAAEREKLFKPLEVAPGKKGSRTLSFEYAGPVGDCEKECGTVKITMTATINVSSGGGKAPEARKHKHEARAHKSPPKKAAEAKRHDLKREGREDLIPALKDAWAARGLSDVPAIGGVAIQDALRAIYDYEIAKDPPSKRYDELAQPRAAEPAALPRCPRTGAQASACEALSSAQAALLKDSATATAIAKAMRATMNRDAGAIKAHDYKAAEAQAKHFEALHKRFTAALSAEGRDGSKVVAKLEASHVSGHLSATQATHAISWLLGQLHKHGISAGAARSLAASALKPQATDAFATLSSPAG